MDGVATDRRARVRSWQRLRPMKVLAQVPGACLLPLNARFPSPPSNRSPPDGGLTEPLRRRDVVVEPEQVVRIPGSLHGLESRELSAPNAPATMSELSSVA